MNEKNDTASKWATLNELAALLERTPRSLREQVARAGVKPRADGKYNMAKVREAVEAAAARDSRNGAAAAGDPDNPKRRKTELECEILRAKLAEIQKTTLTHDAHLEILSHHARIVRGALDQWVAMVGARSFDAALVGEAERLRDAALAKLSEDCGGLDQAPE